MTIIKLSLHELELAQEIEQIAKEFDLTIVKSGEYSCQLIPVHHLGVYGITCEREGHEWCFSRDEDATSWEDFLLMHMTHRIADHHGLLLYYQFRNNGKFVEPTLAHFASFDLYVEYVVRNHQGMMKDMKKKWLYAHKKRFIR